MALREMRIINVYLNQFVAKTINTKIVRVNVMAVLSERLPILNKPLVSVLLDKYLMQIFEHVLVIVNKITIGMEINVSVPQDLLIIT